MWVTETIENLCEIEYGTRVVRKREQGTIYPVYGGGGETFRIDRKNRTSRVVIARFGMSEGCTRYVDGDFFLNDSGLTLSPKGDELSQDFLNKIILSLNDSIYSIGRGTAQKNLNMDAFKKLIISYPPVAEQERIVAKLDAAFAEIDGAVNAAIAKETEVQKLKASLLSSSLTGNAVMWESVKLSEIITFVRGLTYSKKDEVDANGLAVLRATNVSLEHHKITLDEIRYIKTPVKLNEDKLVKVGDILMCTASGSKSHLGKCALVKEDLGMAFGGFMAALRCKSSCLPEYLFYILTSNLFLKRLSSLSDGASINNLKFSQIEDFEFPLPSLEEQERIVAKLDAAYSEFKNANESILKSKVNYLALKSAILSQELQSSEAA